MLGNKAFEQSCEIGSAEFFPLLGIGGPRITAADAIEPDFVQRLAVSAQLMRAHRSNGRAPGLHELRSLLGAGRQGSTAARGHA